LDLHTPELFERALLTFSERDDISVVESILLYYLLLVYVSASDSVLVNQKWQSSLNDHQSMVLGNLGVVNTNWQVVRSTDHQFIVQNWHGFVSLN
jgi:hypothetical protein